MLNKDNVAAGNIVSKYHRKRLYRIFREMTERNEFEAVKKIELKKKGYNLLINEGQVLFQPKKSNKSYPMLFSIEDIKNGMKSYLMFSPQEILKQKTGEIIFLKSCCKDFKTEIILEPKDDYLKIDVRIKSDLEKIIRAGIELNIEALGWNWHEGLRNVVKIKEKGEYRVFSREYPLGKYGKLPLYLFGNLSNKELGFVLGVTPSEPRIFDIKYDVSDKCYQILFDMAISSKTKNFPNEANFSAFLFSLEGEEVGFRAGIEKYYQIFQEAALRRVEKDGIWMPFYDIASIPNAQDFNFAYHEVNVHYDGRLRSKVDIDYNVSNGIYNFAYLEPWLYWLHMSRDKERTYEGALELMNNNLNSEDEKTRDFASAGLLSSVRTKEGKYYVRFEDAPWCYGAVYNSSTDPSMPVNAKCPVNRAGTEIKQIIRCFEDPRFSGAYLDSMQAPEVGFDYDEKHFEFTEFPLTFDKESNRAVISQFITAYHFTELLADYLHDKGKLLMGNFPAAFPFFTQHLDVPGEETIWMKDGKYTPMDDEALAVRRVLSYKKPYLFLQAVDFNIFNKELVERYMKRSLFYGILPSMFSFNAQDAPYWENSDWYNRDRELFKKYLPCIIKLSKAGWEPITRVSIDNEKIFVEQFGKPEDKKFYITVFNQTPQPQKGEMDLSKVASKKKLTVKELLNNKDYSIDIKNPFVELKLDADDVVLFEISNE